MAREGALGSGEMIRVVMAVSRGQHLDGHAEICGCRPASAMSRRCGAGRAGRLRHRVRYSATTLANALSMLCTGLPFHSTTKRWPRRFRAGGAPKAHPVEERAAGVSCSRDALRGGGRTLPVQGRSSRAPQWIVEPRRTLRLPASQCRPRLG
jgi:hypothetical protein